MSASLRPTGPAYALTSAALVMGLTGLVWTQPVAANRARQAGQTTPVVHFVRPSRGAHVRGVTVIRGTATGARIRSVMVAVDHGRHLRARGTAAWQLNLATGRYRNGVHTLVAWAQATDGRSGTARTTVTFANRPGRRPGRRRHRPPLARLTPTPVPAAVATPAPVPAAPATPAPAPVGAGGVQPPPLQAEWQWELSHPLSLTSATDMGLNAKTYAGAPSAPPTVFDIDGFDNSASTVQALNRAGDYTICYIDVGTAENWRPDSTQFPASALGTTNGWPGERWLNIAPGPDLHAIEQIMTARFAMCKQKGFEAVEPDNMDGAENSTGFPITIADQLSYDEWIANTVHSMGMAVAQKNFEDQSAALEPYFDFVIEEQCFQYNDCSSLAPYMAAHKPIYEAEYSTSPASFCPAANRDGFNSVRFDLSLNGLTRIPCR